MERQVIGVIIGSRNSETDEAKINFSFLFFLLSLRVQIDSHHIELCLVNGQDRFLLASCTVPKVDDFSVMDKKRLGPRPVVTVYGDRQTDNPILMLRGRQTESLPLQAAILWERLVFHSFPLLSHEFLWILRCSLLSCSTLLRHIHYFRFPRFCFLPSPLLIPMASFLLYCRLCPLL